MTYATSAGQPAGKGYIPGIDGLRAIAVISVILFHLKSTFLPGGFSGVDVFFVISGYVVTGSLAKERQSNFWRYLLDFYTRRILRIYPALILCLIVATILQTLFVPNSWLSTTSNKTGMAAFFGLSNFALIWLSDGYFSPRVEFNTFTHTWSLAVEEQFYLFFPVIFFIALKFQAKKNVAGALLKTLLPALMVASLAYSAYLTSAQPDHAYYLLPGRFWELACGALLFILNNQQKLIVRSRSMREASIAAGIALIILGLIFSDPKLFPFPWALLPVLGALCAIAGLASDIDNTSSVGQVLNNRPIIYVGKISYSLYLWHWPVIVLFKWTVGLDSLGTMLAAAIVTVAASVFSYRFVERPIRRSKFIASKPHWKIASSGFVIIALSAVVAAGIFVNQPRISLSVTKDVANWYPEWESTLLESRPSANADNLFQGHTIYVLGDSHATAYVTMLNMLRSNHHVSVKLYFKAGCSVANFLRPAEPECKTFIEGVTQKIKTHAKLGDVVFIASLRMNRYADQWARFSDATVQNRQNGRESGPQREAAFQDSKSLIERFQDAGLTVVIDAPKPIFKMPPFRCSDWFNKGNPVCAAAPAVPRAELLAHRKPVMDAIAKLKSTHPKLIVWDNFPLLCPGTTCRASDGALPLFFDGDHISGHANRVLYPSFVDLLTKTWLRNAAAPATTVRH
jgi:peptidoglycan/LPS O-acetylase OafA/YrhL